ncbi:bacterial alpha-L-rhamnosidase-domain-containing protein [Microdochium bolleyi]|uniref:alpha-L-rhamnosidase n=1 Tax=Microdochium bolleyi TaxID=196109 RepID=A0A136J3C5_9PEZI|nr:bacterial alpha-L-rhamnosidase-domain-containing protein [Microdochium bolleyi]
MAVFIAKLTFENGQPALGIGASQPRISWRFDGCAEAWEQQSYDLEVSRSGGATQQTSANTAQSLYVEWPGAPLGSSESASVRIRAHGGEGHSSTPWSDWVTVETGLLNAKDWAGAMPITAQVGNAAAPATKNPTYLRKTFDLPGTVASARLYITGLGIFEAEINGYPVSEDLLAPGYTSYQFRHVYSTYDVTSLLRERSNAIGVIVAQGWYGGRLFPLNGLPVELYYGNSIGAQALLRIQLKDGTIVNIPTDNSWKGNNKGPLQAAAIYDGVTYDSRIESVFQNWTQPSFEDRDWTTASVLPAVTAELASPDAPPVRRKHTFPSKTISKSPSGKTIVDFGQNFAGWLRLTVKGPAGTNITVQHAEVLEGGELALRPLRTAKATDTLILHGNGTQVWEPRFTFHGFRYAQIDGWPVDETPLDASSIEAVAIWSDLEETGSFQCSNSLLNQFHSNVIWSMRSNFISVPTDCPQRDERMGWTGDAHVFGPTANFLYNTASFWRGWHKDVYAEMKANPTVMAVPTYVPLTPPGYGNSDAMAVWGDVAVGGPWNLWRAFGDPAMLAEHRTQAQGWLDQGVKRRSSDGLLWDRSGFQFGDWLDPLAPPEAPGNGTTDKYLVADAYLVRMTELMANISAALGNEADATRYRQQHADLRSAFREAWVDPATGAMANHTQTAYVLGIVFDILDAKGAGRDDGAAARLIDLVRTNDHLVGTGFAATALLGHAMTKAGADTDFYTMLLQTKAPSWLYQVVMGATTTWERWDSLLPNGTINYHGDMTSFNHYAFGAVADWMHTRIGGLSPSLGGPGWKEVDVSPLPGLGVDSAEASFTSGYGTVSTSWYIRDGGFYLTVRVPPNARAVVTLPYSKKISRVGSGVYYFVDSIIAVLRSGL